MDVSIRIAWASDAQFIGENMRLDDVIELRAGGSEPVAATVDAFALSRWCRVATIDGVPAVIWGVCDSGEAGIGVPWMLATKEFSRIGKRFALGCRNQVEDMKRGYRLLGNRVYAKNHLSIKWLQWLGFDLGEAEPDGFIPFFMECVHV